MAALSLHMCSRMNGKYAKVEWRRESQTFCLRPGGSAVSHTSEGIGGEKKASGSKQRECQLTLCGGLLTYSSTNIAFNISTLAKVTSG